MCDTRLNEILNGLPACPRKEEAKRESCLVGNDLNESYAQQW